MPHQRLLCPNYQEHMAANYSEVGSDLKGCKYSLICCKGTDGFFGTKCLAAILVILVFHSCLKWIT